MTEEDRIKIQQIMQDLASQVLRQEQMTPGVQDSDLVSWAKNKLSGNDTPLQSAPTVPVPQPPQTSTPAVPAQPDSGAVSMTPPPSQVEEEGVLHIQRPGQTFQPNAASSRPAAHNNPGVEPASNNSQGNGEQ